MFVLFFLARPDHRFVRHVEFADDSTAAGKRPDAHIPRIAMLEPIRAHMRNADHPATVLIVTADAAEHELASARIGQGGS